MQINKIGNTQSFGMPLAKDFYRCWTRPQEPFASSCEAILNRLDKTTPEHFITRAHNFIDSFWVAAPKIGSKARRIKVGENMLFRPTEYDSLVVLDENLSKEYKRLAKLNKKH